MQSLAPEESRKLLDAMGIPVVMLRERTDGSDSMPARAAGSAQISRPQEGEAARDALLQVAVEISPEVAPMEAFQAPSAASEKDQVKTNTAVAGGKNNADAPLQFSLVSVITPDAMLLVELPSWSSGLLDGRLTAVCGDLLRLISVRSDTADWQYFHWPIEGMPDASKHAATEAVDAWLHRRWAEMEAVEPRVLTSIQSLDGKLLTSDACLLPPLVDLVSNPSVKREAWNSLKAWLYAEPGA